MEADILYCWFGGQALPAAAKNYVSGWGKVMPATPIIEVNEHYLAGTTNLYVKQATAAQKFAFVSDYARLAYLYEHGGIYLDTDVEVCRDLTPLVSDSELVLSLEYYEWELTGVNTGTIIAPPKHPFIGEVLASYENETFVDQGAATLTINQRMTNLLVEKGLVLANYEQLIAGVRIYPYEYFCTNNPKAYTIHHYASSWQGKQSVVRKLRRRLGKLVKRLVGRERFAKLWK